MASCGKVLRSLTKLLFTCRVKFAVPKVAVVLLGFSLVVCWRIVVRWREHVRPTHRSTSLHVINVFQLNVPAIGYTFPVLSMVSAIRTCFYYKERMQKGYTKVNTR